MCIFLCGFNEYNTTQVIHTPLLLRTKFKRKKILSLVLNTFVRSFKKIRDFLYSDTYNSFSIIHLNKYL